MSPLVGSLHDCGHIVHLFLRLAPEKGWAEQYIGNAVKALLKHIQTLFPKNKSLQDRNFYAKYTTIVQSSGMGKSRVVDEMSKFHFVIPVNLRQPESSGIPTPLLHCFP
jgi:hypothetical protein